MILNFLKNKSKLYPIMRNLLYFFNVLVMFFIHEKTIDNDYCKFKIVCSDGIKGESMSEMERTNGMHLYE